MLQFTQVALHAEIARNPIAPFKGKSLAFEVRARSLWIFSGDGITVDLIFLLLFAFVSPTASNQSYGYAADCACACLCLSISVYPYCRSAPMDHDIAR
jgi:hypothetical protein